MVQVTFDTNNDSLPELEEALRILQQAIERRKGSPAQPEPAEETAIDIPFLKVTVRSEPPPQEERAPEAPKMPTLNQLLTDESLTEEELTRLFKEQQLLEGEKKQEKKKKTDDPYIEIVEYSED